MAVAAGTGCAVALSTPSELFTELPSRFVVATSSPGELCTRARARGIPAQVLGEAGGERLVVGDLLDLPVAALREAHEGNLAHLLADS
jgi:phosphoribosylformylglycinamidine synthase